MEFLIILGGLAAVVYAAYRHVLAGEQQRSSRRDRHGDAGGGFYDGSHHGCDHSHSDSGDFGDGGCDGGGGGD